MQKLLFVLYFFDFLKESIWQKQNEEDIRKAQKSLNKKADVRPNIFIVIINVNGRD